LCDVGRVVFTDGFELISFFSSIAIIGTDYYYKNKVFCNNDGNGDGARYNIPCVLITTTSDS